MDASKTIDQYIAGFPDWRGKTLATIRKVIRQAVPDVVEEWKWMGSPVWNSQGILCVANAHAKWVRVTFLKGASLPDPRKVFNAVLEAPRRAIKIEEGDKFDEAGFKGIILAAAAQNKSKPAARKAA